MVTIENEISKDVQKARSFFEKFKVDGKYTIFSLMDGSIVRIVSNGSRFDRYTREGEYCFTDRGYRNLIRSLDMSGDLPK